MTINKYQGKTKEEAVEKARQELGAGAVVLNVKEIKPKGMFKMFRDISYEVTVAMEEKERFQSPLPAGESVKTAHEGISLAAAGGKKGYPDETGAGGDGERGA